MAFRNPLVTLKKHLTDQDSRQLNESIKKKGFASGMHHMTERIHPEHVHHFGHNKEALKHWFKTNPAHLKHFLDENNLSVHNSLDNVIDAIHKHYQRKHSDLYKKQSA